MSKFYIVNIFNIQTIYHDIGEEFLMSNEEILQFSNAFEDFMKHNEIEETSFHQNSKYDQSRKEIELMIENEIEKKAEKLKITCDYYISEFL